MRVNKIELVNFRNYEYKLVEFKDGLNVIEGPNAMGKTNILEGINMFSLGKSGRTSKDLETIRHGCDEARLKMEFVSRGRTNLAEIKIFKNRRKLISVNEIPIKKNSMLIGKFNVVYFGPEFLSIVKDGPGGRRKNTDILISQLRPSYFEELARHKKIIESKLSILKSGNVNKDIFSVYNESLASTAAAITLLRREYTKKTEAYAAELQNEISGGNEALEIKYIPSIGNIENLEFDAIRDSYFDELERIKSKEIERRECLLGAHRDNFEYMINGFSARRFGSQGQQKTCVLVQKLAEVYLIEEETGEFPVLLLDDIMSELDEKRQQYISNKIKDMQIIITKAKA